MLVAGVVWFGLIYEDNELLKLVSFCPPCLVERSAVLLNRIWKVCNVRSSWNRKGAVVLIRMLSHYDVFDKASTPLGDALQVMYCEVLETDDAGVVSERGTVQQDYS